MASCLLLKPHRLGCTLTLCLVLAASCVSLESTGTEGRGGSGGSIPSLEPVPATLAGEGGPFVDNPLPRAFSVSNRRGISRRLLTEKVFFDVLEVPHCGLVSERSGVFHDRCGGSGRFLGPEPHVMYVMEERNLQSRSARVFFVAERIWRHRTPQFRCPTDRLDDFLRQGATPFEPQDPHHQEVATALLSQAERATRDANGQAVFPPPQTRHDTSVSFLSDVLSVHEFTASTQFRIDLSEKNLRLDWEEQPKTAWNVFGGGPREPRGIEHSLELKLDRGHGDQLGTEAGPSESAVTMAPAQPTPKESLRIGLDFQHPQHKIEAFKEFRIFLREVVSALREVRDPFRELASVRTEIPLRDAAAIAHSVRPFLVRLPRRRTTAEHSPEAGQGVRRCSDVFEEDDSGRKFRRALAVEMRRVADVSLEEQRDALAGCAVVFEQRAPKWNRVVQQTGSCVQQEVVCG